MMYVRFNFRVLLELYASACLSRLIDGGVFYLDTDV
jgi:hypothetical protein